jgi:hypothetical protein
MKPFLKTSLQLILWLLSLQVLKVVIERAEFQHAILYSIGLTCLQVILFLWFIFSPVYKRIVGRLPGTRRTQLIAGSLLFFLALSLLELLSVYLLKHSSAIPALFQKSFANYYQEFDRSIITFEPEKAQYDQGLFYMLKPDTTLTFDNREFKTTLRTNAKGLRDDDASLVKPEIICLGDSYTFGWGVSDHLPFPDLLEKRTGCTVLNAGVSSFGTAREMMLLSQLDTSNLQYLVIQYCDNDEQENTAFVKNNYKLDISSKAKYDYTSSMLTDKIKYFPGKVFLLTASDLFTQPFQLVKKVAKHKLRKKEAEARTFLEVLRHANINFKK